MFKNGQIQDHGTTAYDKMSQSMGSWKSKITSGFGKAMLGLMSKVPGLKKGIDNARSGKYMNGPYK